MKRENWSTPWRHLALVAVLCGASCTSDGGGSSAPVAKPLELKSKDVLGYFAISGFNRALKDVSAIANLFAPGQMSPENLKSQIGAMFGPELLEDLEMEKPILVLLVKAKEAGALPAPAVVLPLRKKEAFEKVLTGMGMMSAFDNGLLMVGLRGPEVLGAPATLTESYREIAGAGIPKTARLQLHLGSLMPTLQPMIEQGISQYLQMFQSMAAMANGSTAEQAKFTTNLLQIEVKGFLALLNQVEATQVDLDLSGQRIGIDNVVTARAGTALHEFMSLSSRASSPSSVLPEGSRFLLGGIHCDALSFGKLFKQLVDEAAKGPDAAALAESAAMFLEIGKWWGGLAAFGIGPGKESGITLDYDVEILDETAFLAAIEKGLGMFSPGGALSNLYSGMGLELTAKLEKAAREHAGAPVHRWKMAIEAKDPKSPLAANLDAMKSLLKDVEIVLVKGHGLLSSDPGRLDAMIDLVNAGGAKGPVLRAQKIFGAGRHGYFDYDLIGLLKTMMTIMPQNPASKPMADSLGKVKSTDPMVFAITFGAGSAQAQLGIPLQPFAEMVPNSK